MEYFLKQKKIKAKIKNKMFKKIANLKKTGKKTRLNPELTLKKNAFLKRSLTPLKKTSVWFILNPIIGRKEFKNSAKTER